MDDDVEGAVDGRRARGEQIADANGEDAANVFSLMDNVNDKLKIIGYETKFCKGREFKPLTGLYFALAGKASDQFPYFSSLTAWMLTELDPDFIEWDQFDDPNAISSAVIKELRRLGFKADNPVSKLRHGSGDAVCLALNFLCDKVLKKNGFQVLPPVYANTVAEEEVADDDDAEMEDEMEEDMEDDDDGLFTAEEYFAGPKGEDRSPEDLEMQKVLESKVDPREWMLELERVGPRLKFRADPNSNSKEWRTHIEQSAKHEEKISSIFPTTKTSLGTIGKELRAAVERISSKERSINKDFDHLGSDFRDRQKKLDEIQENYNELSQSVSQLTAELAEKTESVDIIKTQMSERNNSMTDNSPLRNIADGLANLKKEVSGMELRIGVVSQTLLASQIKQATDNSKRTGKTPADYIIDY